jgi:4-hydroxybenzoate polyprenyltransferase
MPRRRVPPGGCNWKPFPERKITQKEATGFSALFLIIALGVIAPPLVPICIWMAYE